MAVATSLPSLEDPESAPSFRVSPTLAAGADLEARRSRGERVLAMGFGEAGLPVLPTLCDRLATSAGCNSYGPVAGHESLRVAAAGYWTRRGLPTDPSLVVAGPGSKALLFGLLLGLDGDVAVPRPSWVSYAAQSWLTGRPPVYVPTAPPHGGVPDPGELAAAVKSARAAGRRIAAVIVTLPDNPTGTLASAGVIRELCDVAARHDLLIISDEIYRDLVYSSSSFVSPASLEPSRTVITTGLSKNLALGGWRLGVARLPSADVRDRLLAIGSEIWSAPAGPVQSAAALAFDEGPDVIERVRRSRLLHGRVARTIASTLASAGLSVSVPAGGFYVYPDFASFRSLLLRKHAVSSSQGLAELLLRRYGIGVLEGSAFGEPAGALRLRMATSRLYGDSAALQETALASDDPLRLPWIADAVDWLASSLSDLLS
jgi:aspartate aminotransferase